MTWKRLASYIRQCAQGGARPKAVHDADHVRDFPRHVTAKSAAVCARGMRRHLCNVGNSVTRKPFEMRCSLSSSYVPVKPDTVCARGS